MVAITVAIAATVYIYVSNVINKQGTIMEARGTFLGAVNDNGSYDMLFVSGNGSSFTLHDMKGVDLSRLDCFIGRSVVCRYVFNTTNGDKFLGMYLDSELL
jgi:FlaG/FlaF family flagellin (archaellin)